MSTDSQRLLSRTFCPILLVAHQSFPFASCTVNWTMELNQLHCGNELWRGICDLRIVGSRPLQDFFFLLFFSRKKKIAKNITQTCFFPPFFSQFSVHIVSKVLFLSFIFRSDTGRDVSSQGITAASPFYTTLPTELGNVMYPFPSVKLAKRSQYLFKKMMKGLFCHRFQQIM